MLSLSCLAPAHTQPLSVCVQWLTLDYDEWMCVLKGRMVLLSNNGASQLEVIAGQTVFIAKGERFKPEFPEGGTEYVPVCLPAFRPDRCAREDGPTSQVSQKLKELHGPPAAKRAKVEPTEDQKPEVLYHMLPTPTWAAAKASGEAYFPPTFEQDDSITHATGVPSRLIDTANHYYQSDPHPWTCLRLTRTALRKCGIPVRDEEATPVGDTPTDGKLMGSWVCPHIVGGIPISVVDAEFSMVRDGPRFVKIEGLSI